MAGWVVVAVNAPPPSQYAAPEKRHLEQKIKTLWSTPWSTKNKSYGAFCFFPKIDINNNNMKHSIWRQISATWSTPYGLENMSYGALHTTLEESFKANSEALHTATE